jgi:folate-dependent phosphoribosylglycinamide formyltransferase PurN
LSATSKKDKNPETPALEQYEGFKEEIATAVEELRATVQVLAGYMAKINGRMEYIQENMKEEIMT